MEEPRTDEAFFGRLDEVVERSWQAGKRGPFWSHVRTHGCDPLLGCFAMVEMFHLVRHNAINQAVAALRVPPGREALLKWCFRHAQEELGHERMIVRDLAAHGLADVIDDVLAGPPLPATQAFVGYLYAVALRQGAEARLGYSYWAESSYQRFDELFAALSARTSLEPTRSMSFFKEHMAIDRHHEAETRRVLEVAALSPAQQEEVIQVARTTIYLQNALLDGCLARYLDLSAPAHGDAPAAA